jgi:hypothetical protein
MIRIVNLIIFIIFILLSYSLKGQENKYEEFIIGDKIYKPGCGWIKVGLGSSYNIKLKTNEKNINLSYSFRVKDSYFQLGYHASSDVFFTLRSYQKLTDLYGAMGLRKESKKYNISAFAGPSYAYGGYYFDADSLGKKRYKGFTDLGIVVNAEYTRKIYYDLGLGLSLFGSFNKSYSVIGIQVHIYFSGAFRGQIN